MPHNMDGLTGSKSNSLQVINQQHPHRELYNIEHSPDSWNVASTSTSKAATQLNTLSLSHTWFVIMFSFNACSVMLNYNTSHSTFTKTNSTLAVFFLLPIRYYSNNKNSTSLLILLLSVLLFIWEFIESSHFPVFVSILCTVEVRLRWVIFVQQLLCFTLEA